MKQSAALPETMVFFVTSKAKKRILSAFGWLQSEGFVVKKAGSRVEYESSWLEVHALPYKRIEEHVYLRSPHGRWFTAAGVLGVVNTNVSEDFPQFETVSELMRKNFEAIRELFLNEDEERRVVLYERHLQALDPHRHG